MSNNKAFKLNNKYLPIEIKFVTGSHQLYYKLKLDYVNFEYIEEIPLRDVHLIDSDFNIYKTNSYSHSVMKATHIEYKQYLVWVIISTSSLFVDN